MRLTHRPDLAKARQRMLFVGGVMSVVILIGAFVSPTMFFTAYLYAYLFWLGIALGGLAIVMMHHLSGGGWGFAIRRILEAAFMTLPLLAILFIPLLFGLGRLYPWADAAQVADDPVLQKHLGPFALPWFVLRATLYFAIWIGLALRMRGWSLEQDRTGNPAITERFQKWSGPGLILYLFSMSLAAIDWIMSLEPRWFSTIFGLVVIVGQGLTAIAFAIVIAWWFVKGVPAIGSIGETTLSKEGDRTSDGTEPEVVKQEALNPDDPIPNIHPPFLDRDAPTLEAQLGTVWQDLGGLLLTFVLLWVYMAFSQYVIIWSGDLPSEIAFYLHRRHGLWRWFAWVMIIMHFALPFVLLLFGGLKRNLRLLAAVASLVLTAHFLNVFWLVKPKFAPEGFAVSWLDVATPLAIGGLWLTVFFTMLGRATLLPQKDPRLMTPEVAEQAQLVREELG